jgi:SAM-dependent methyltransferase
VGKKGTVTVKRKKNTAVKERPDRDLSHNRTKQYILQEGSPVDFLVGLGVQSPDGHIAKARYDKFRQINRYLELIEDVLDALPKEGTIRIIDFGCGKSYLTFAMYYYLHQMQNRDIRVTGLDLKEDVIRHCNELAERLHYDRLHFEQGDIQSYEGEDAVDMVVSLHACDKATDYALEKAVKWGASVIMAVPCCQHELNSQIRCDVLQPVLKYGLVRERIAALVTDALRADLLEQQGYATQILEFIDMQHTPKNLMIRAVKEKGMRPAARAASIEEVTEFLHVNPTLKELL